MPQPVEKGKFASVSLIFACGTALFSDGYSNGVIGNIVTLLTRIYGADALGNNTSNTLTSLAFGGMILGMLTFGYIVDRFGRKFGMLVSAGIIAFFAALSSASSGANDSFSGMIAMLGACRFLLGIGLGAEYPCGSVSASEQSEEPAISRYAQNRWFALATNTMIDFGFVIASFVPLVLYWIFGPDHLRAVWRLSLGLGFFPALAVFIWRLVRLEEPKRFKKDSMQRCKVPYVLIIKRYWKGLAAISIIWFIYDFITYPFGIYATTVVNNVTGGSTALSIIFGWGVIINLFYMPGTIGGAFVVDYLGPKNTLITGLMCQAVIGFIMSGLYDQLSKHIAAFAVVYGIFLSLGELGPGNCTGILASKSCPTAIRGEYYGIAAAIGKVGAFIGTWTFPRIIKSFGGSTTLKGNTGPFWIGSGLAVLSALISVFFIKPLSNDGMIEEDANFRVYLEENGFDTSQMGLLEETSTADVWTLGSADKVDEKEMVQAA